MTTIDLNADLGEGYESDVELLRVVSSCNIACGGHAGDAETMAATVALAVGNDVAIGAHPSYPDRAEFGRKAHFCAGDELAKSLIKQIDSLNNVAHEAGADLRHVKPHGALYNDADKDDALAEIVVLAALAVCPRAAIVGPPNGALQRAAARLEMDFVPEGFVDRAYAADGSLVSRSKPNAVHDHVNTITTQALRLAKDGEVTAENGDVISIAARTLCLHGDTPNAAELGRAVRDVLSKSGVDIHAVT
jgi:UPF0271 protein